ncbi:hypothetical protein Dimus_010825, partial [Dionaea muscipula]
LKPTRQIKKRGGINYSAKPYGDAVGPILKMHDIVGPNQGVDCIKELVKIFIFNLMKLMAAWRKEGAEQGDVVVAEQATGGRPPSRRLVVGRRAGSGDGAERVMETVPSRRCPDEPPSRRWPNEPREQAMMEPPTR